MMRIRARASNLNGRKIEIIRRRQGAVSMMFRWPRVRVVICFCWVLSVRSIVVSFEGIKNEKESRETEENVKERKNDRFSKSQTSTQRRVASRRRQVDEPCFSPGFNDIDPSKFDRSFERLIFSRSTVSHPDLYRIGLSQSR